MTAWISMIGDADAGPTLQAALDSGGRAAKEVSNSLGDKFEKEKQPSRHIRAAIIHHLD